MEASEDDRLREQDDRREGAPASAKKFADIATRPCPCRCRQTQTRPERRSLLEPANNTYPFGCHISMLEIDRETGEPTLLKLGWTMRER
jgi:CO/xanthine dehydrogenase Mo-binding subunit